MRIPISIAIALGGSLLLSACSDSDPDASKATTPSASESAQNVSRLEKSSLPLPPKLERRLEELEKIKVALQEYREDKGSYPLTAGWYGVGSKWGKDTNEWVPGLSPEYLQSLPIDVDSPVSQYLYVSDGKGYKLIVHNAHDCEALRQVNPDLIDPRRDKEGTCWAYGYWSVGMAAF